MEHAFAPASAPELHRPFVVFLLHARPFWNIWILCCALLRCSQDVAVVCGTLTRQLKILAQLVNFPGSLCRYLMMEPLGMPELTLLNGNGAV